MLNVKLIPQVIDVFPEAPALLSLLIFADGNVINLCSELLGDCLLRIPRKMASFNVILRMDEMLL